MIESLPLLAFIVASAAGVSALCLGAVLRFKFLSSDFYHKVSRVMWATAVVHIANALSQTWPGYSDAFRALAIGGELALPILLLSAGNSLTIASDSSPGRNTALSFQIMTITAGVLATLSVIVALSQLFFGVDSVQNLAPIFLRGLYGFILLSLSIALAQLEQILRATKNPYRYQLKFVLIGLGALTGYQIYQSGQLLLTPVWHGEYIVAGGMATLISIGVIGYGLGRSRLKEVTTRVYLSPQMLYGSLTFIVIGLYLVGVGILEEWLTYTNQPLGSSLGSLVVFLAAIALVVVSFSRNLRAKCRQFIGRHFYRSKYDYRASWLMVTDSFQLATSTETILDRLLDVLSSIFGAARMSVWMLYETDSRYHQVRSVNTEDAPSPLEIGHPVITALRNTDSPLSLDEWRTLQSEEVCQEAQEFLQDAQSVLVVPIRFEQVLTAFISLGPELNGKHYEIDDQDLLRAIAHQVGMLLSHARLAEERTAAAELDALHRFSAFCLHDLKNLAARLSLLVQNAESYGDNPEFQQSVIRTVAGTSQKMMGLISKISLKSVEVKAADTLVVQDVLEEVVGGLKSTSQVTLTLPAKGLPPVLFNRDQFQQLVLNLILNAQHAAGDRGNITVSAKAFDHRVQVTVADTGCGISPSELRTLFQPFRTTKREGLGIGLYECKQVIEAHRGTIRVLSEFGRGTTVILELPCIPDDVMPVPEATTTNLS